jgi:hypothetical protein
MYVLVTGSRFWEDKVAIEEELSLFPAEATLVHGACRGADLIAAEVWKGWGRDVISCPVTDAEWKQRGRRAGPERNKRMVDTYPPVRAAAFRLSAVGGTAHMVGLLHARRIHFVERWAPCSERPAGGIRSEYHAQPTIDAYFARTKFMSRDPAEAFDSAGL